MCSVALTELFSNVPYSICVAAFCPTLTWAWVINKLLCSFSSLLKAFYNWILFTCFSLLFSTCMHIHSSGVEWNELCICRRTLIYSYSIAGHALAPFDWNYVTFFIGKVSFIWQRKNIERQKCSFAICQKFILSSIIVLFLSHLSICVIDEAI